VNVSPNAMQWDTDLIGYDAQRSYGFADYYAQVMFGSYIGDENAVSAVEMRGRGSSIPLPRIRRKAGCISSW